MPSRWGEIWGFWTQRRLPRRLALLFVGGALIPLLLLQGFILIEGRRQLVGEVRFQLQTQAQQVKGEVEGWLEARKRLLNSLVHLEPRLAGQVMQRNYPDCSVLALWEKGEVPQRLLGQEVPLQDWPPKEPLPHIGWDAQRQQAYARLVAPVERGKGGFFVAWFDFALLHRWRGTAHFLLLSPDGLVLDASPHFRHRRGTKWEGEPSSERRDWVTAAVPLQEGLQLLCFHPVPTPSAFLARFLWFNLFLLGGGLVAMLAMALWSSLTLALPILRLREAAQTFGQGRFTPRVEVRTGDEIEDLALTFNRMADELQSLYGHLEEQVAQRTRELQQANEELAILKEFNETIVRAIPSSVLVFDTELRLLYANETFFRTWEYPIEILGKHVEEVFPDGRAEREGWLNLLRLAIREGQSVIGQVMEHHSPYRGRTVVRFSIVPLHENQHLSWEGQRLSDAVCLQFLARTCSQTCQDCIANAASWQGKKALLILDDVTEQHALEQQLIQSEKMAALGQLSAGIAHEIRNPLSAINAAAFYISEAVQGEGSLDREELSEYLGLIRRNVARAEKIVYDILEFARPSGPSPRPVNLQELVEKTLAILDKAFVEQEVTLHADLQPVPPVLCRPDTVKQAVLNVLVNALQAMPEGGDLFVRTYAEKGMGIVEVRDTGPGIPPEVLPRIFDPFFTTKEPGKGTGLGLSIARAAVEADQGRIWVLSPPGEGATFFIGLPLAPPPSDGRKVQEREPPLLIPVAEGRNDGGEGEDSAGGR